VIGHERHARSNLLIVKSDNPRSTLAVRRLRDEHPGCDIRLFEEETDRKLTEHW
jgi:hypothetical protein